MLLLGFYCQISQAQSQQDSLRIHSRKFSLWLGVDFLRPLATALASDGSFFQTNQAMEVFVLFGKRPNQQYFVSLGYATEGSTVFRNLTYRNNIRFAKIGTRLGHINKVRVGFNLLYYRFYESGKYEIGGSYFGTLSHQPYSISFSGLGFEIPVNLDVPLGKRIYFHLELTPNFIFHNVLSENLEKNRTVRNTYNLYGMGLFPTRGNDQINLNMLVGIKYRIK